MVVKQKKQRRKTEVFLATAAVACFFLAHVIIETNAISDEDLDVWDSIKTFSDIVGLMLVLVIGLTACFLIIRSLWWHRGHPLFTHGPDVHGISYFFEATVAVTHFWYDNQWSSRVSDGFVVWRAAYRIFGTLFAVFTWIIVNYTATNILRVYVRQKLGSELQQHDFEEIEDAAAVVGSRAEPAPTKDVQNVALISGLYAPRVVVSGRTFALPSVSRRARASATFFTAAASGPSASTSSILEKISHPVLEDTVPWLLWPYTVLAAANAAMGMWVLILTLFYVVPGYSDYEPAQWYERVYHVAFAFVLLFYYNSSVKLSYCLLNPRLNILYPYYQDLLRDFTIELDIQQGDSVPATLRLRPDTATSTPMSSPGSGHGGSPAGPPTDQRMSLEHNAQLRGEVIQLYKLMQQHGAEYVERGLGTAAPLEPGYEAITAGVLRPRSSLRAQERAARERAAQERDQELALRSPEPERASEPGRFFSRLLGPRPPSTQVSVQEPLIN
eukprot:TRINITY_DN1389_c0_g1_i1.p1 TRINITY_DN1389_c0_g1~~TRINITY_DN1389_c0_g1_i1.p1  ORF type:complete len:551 (+),score=124.80 TRINITY_DN1389_c0_g1_i1:156-1655(+)